MGDDDMKGGYDKDDSDLSSGDEDDLSSVDDSDDNADDTSGKKAKPLDRFLRDRNDSDADIGFEANIMSSKYNRLKELFSSSVRSSDVTDEMCNSFNELKARFNELNDIYNQSGKNQNHLNKWYKEVSDIYKFSDIIDAFVDDADDILDTMPIASDSGVNYLDNFDDRTKLMLRNLYSLDANVNVAVVSILNAIPFQETLFELIRNVTVQVSEYVYEIEKVGALLSHKSNIVASITKVSLNSIIGTNIIFPHINFLPEFVSEPLGDFMLNNNLLRMFESCSADCKKESVFLAISGIISIEVLVLDVLSDEKLCYNTTIVSQIIEEKAMCLETFFNFIRVLLYELQRTATDVNVQQLLWEKNGSNTETVQNDILIFNRNIDETPNFFRSPLEIEYSLIDPVRKIDSFGFIDLRDSNYVNYTITCSQYPLMFDGIQLGEIWKDKINNNIEIMICSMQTSLREMAYTPESQLIILTDFTNINNTLLTDVLVPDDYFSHSVSLAASSSRSTLASGVNMASLKSMSRFSGGRKRSVMDAAGSAYTSAPEQSFLNSVMKNQNTIKQPMSPTILIYK